MTGEKCQPAPLGLGCWAFGGGLWRTQQRSDSIRTIHAAIRGGIRHFDTAQNYGKGASEQIVGQQLRRFSHELPRSSYAIATKIRLPRNVSDLEQLVRVSLRRLCTTYIDILYIHWPDSSKDLVPYLKELQRLNTLGLFHHLGVSNFPEDLIRLALRHSNIRYCQIPVSLLWTKSLRDISQVCSEHSISIVGYSPLGLGILGGNRREQEDFAHSDFRRGLYCFDEPYRAAFHALLDQIDQTSAVLDLPPSAVALLWARTQPVDMILTGARTKEQIVALLDTDALAVTPDAFASVEKAALKLAELVPRNEDNIFFHRW
ncbi:MAG TPA: aldo/keto reductase [Sphaerochaetaceae bacterium]|nr:aldo/keto reductase [Sphaerochaetaceae bacterium]